MPEVARSLALFAVAGLAEIGAGWLVWQFLHASRPSVVDGFRPDRWDLLGVVVSLIGMLIIFFGPRGAPT